VPIEPTEPATTSGTDRRAFLTRSAAGGALVATAATTGFAGLGLVAAGAQEGTADTRRSINQQYVLGAIPLELAAVVAYDAALSGDALSGDLATTLRRFQRNHQDVAADLTGRAHADDDIPTADPAVAAQFSPPAGADEAAVLTTLASLEEALSATHLGAIATFEDTSFAKVLSQFLTVEAQQAVALGRAAEQPLDALTPAIASTDGGLEASQLEAGQTVPSPAALTDDESDEESEDDAETEADAETDSDDDAN